MAIVVAELGAPARRPRQIVFTDVNILLHININIIAIIVVARLGAFGHGPPCPWSNYFVVINIAM